MKRFFLLCFPLFLFSNWIADTNVYGHKLLSHLHGEGNRIISPLSTRIALLMAFVGASGETEAAMEKTLCIGSEVLPPAFPANLSIACSAWVDSRLTVLSPFEQTIKSGFSADLLPVSFLQAEKAAKAMNQWISEKTEGKISQLIESSSIDPLSRLFLLNTVFYQEPWRTPFDPKRTTSKPFYGKRSTKSVPTMQGSGTFLYHDDGQQQVVALPLSGEGRPALVIVLPKEGREASAVDIALLKPMHLQVELPKFALKQRFDLVKPLIEMGMTTAFTNKANFSGITGDTSVKIAAVLTETLLDVNEAGVCASAATSVQMNCKSVMGPGIKVAINRPFSVMLLDLETNLPIILGEICTL